MKPLQMIVLVSCFSPLLASAQGRPQPRLVLQALDTDHDGRLSASEIAAAPQALTQLDLNHDGQLTPDEITPRLDNAGAKPDELVQQLMVFDKNGDGVLSAYELPARMQGMFRRGDTNHDGKLTSLEIRAMALSQGAPNGTPIMPGQASGIMRMDPVLNALDADHDGTISAAEITASSKSLLTLDTDHDGMLSPDETKVRQMTSQERAAHLLDEWDTNKDGKLSKEECPDRMAADFDKIDTNTDSFLDQAELVVYFNTAPAAPRRGGNDATPAPNTPKEKQ